VQQLSLLGPQLERPGPPGTQLWPGTPGPPSKTPPLDEPAALEPLVLPVLLPLDAKRSGASPQAAANIVIPMSAVTFMNVIL
jgi:hypothetical protein